MPTVALLVLVGAILYFMTAEERARVFAACATAPRTLPRAARLCRLEHDDPFYVALRARARVPIVTGLLLAANVAVFGGMVFGTGGAGAPDTLIAWGASYGPRTTDGERWRLFTSIFVHHGFLHLLVSLAALAQAGFIAERLVGRATFATVYVAAGVLGSIIALVQAPLVVSAGPAAALFSVYGMLLAAAIRGGLQQPALRVPWRACKTLVPGALAFATWFIATGTTPAIAKVGVCAGLVGGIVLTRVVRDPKTRVIRFAALTAATTIVVLMAAMAVRVVSDIRPDIAAVMAIEQRTATLYANAVTRFKTGRSNSGALIQMIEHTILPALEGARTRVGTLRNMPQPDGALVADTEAYLALRHESWRLRAEALRKANMGTLRQAERTEQASLEAFDKLKSALVAQ